MGGKLSQSSDLPVSRPTGACGMDPA